MAGKSSLKPTGHKGLSLHLQNREVYEAVVVPNKKKNHSCCKIYLPKHWKGKTVLVVIKDEES